MIKSKVVEALELLEGGSECTFDLCHGPDKPFVGMLTCHVCAAIQALRKAFGRPATMRFTSERSK